MKNQNKTKKENPWKTATIVLGATAIFLIFYIMLVSYQEISEINKITCDNIKATPAWVDSRGNILSYGLITINQSSQEFSNNLTNLLVAERISFVYSEGCSYCQLQKAIFGKENFKRLEKEGLAINCSK